jgi:anti-sigma regulatory factor (Ser/Thr protein kinase)
MTSASSWHRTLRIDGSPEPVRALRTAVRSFLTDHSLPDQEVNGIVLAFSEALDNAVEHGSAGEESRLEVRVRFAPTFVLLSLRDQGSDRIPLGCAIEPDDESERGRGFRLMNQLMDYVRVKVYSSGGTRVSMLRRLHLEG